MATFHSVDYAARPVDPDGGREIEYSILHTKYLWWSTAGFIGLVSVVQLTSYLHTKLASRRRDLNGQAHNPEQAGSSRSRHLSLRRFPVAIVNTYRIVAFRCTFGIGSYKLNLAEVFLTAAYIVMLFALTFLNSMSFPIRLQSQCSPSNSDIFGWCEARHGLLGELQLRHYLFPTKFKLIGQSSWRPGCQPIPSDHCPGDEEQCHWM